jgi:hypothetical protein
VKNFAADDYFSVATLVCLLSPTALDTLTNTSG